MGCDSIIRYNLLIPSINTMVFKEQATLTSYAINSNFQWLDCSNDLNPINGEIEGKFTATKNGIYAVEIEQYGCVDTSKCIEVNNVGIPTKVNKSNLRISPNPTNGNFQLLFKSENLSPIIISLKNMLGQTIWAKTHSSNTNFSGEIPGPTGIYFLKINQGGNKEKTLKIVKTNY